MAISECPDCDGSGEVWEPCDCYECEYDDKHGQWILCISCQEVWDDDLSEILAKWRQDPANLEPEMCPTEDPHGQVLREESLQD